MQCQIDGCINSSHLLGALRERSGEDEYPYHQQYVLVACAYGKLVDALFQFKPPCNGDGVAGRQQEGHRNRHFIEIVYKQ